MTLEHLIAEVARILINELVIVFQGLVKLTYRHSGIGKKLAKGRDSGMLLQQQCCLLHRLLEPLAFEQYLGVIVPGSEKIRFELKAAFQQEVGIIENTQFCRNFCQQSHPLHVLPIFLYKSAAQLFCFIELALMNHAGHREQFGRQLLQSLRVLLTNDAALIVAALTVELDEILPADQERWIELHGLFIGL